MEDFVGRADLLTPDQLAELSRRSDARAFLRLAMHGAILVATGHAVWFATGTWWLVPAMLAHGIVVAFLFCGHHELIHRTPFRTRWLNDWIAFATGFIVFYPAFYFRLFHFAHHRHTQDPERDPELSSPPPKTRRAFLWWALGLPYWRRRFATSFVHAVTGRVTQPFVRPRDVASCVTEARWMWAGYVAVAALSLWFESWAAVQYWLGPILLGQPFLRLYLMAEHTGCANTGDLLDNTRTTLTNAAVRQLAWNMPYHAEHHVFPAVPFYALPRLHRMMRGHPRVVAAGYISAHLGLWRGLRHGTR